MFKSIKKTTENIFSEEKQKKTSSREHVRVCVVPKMYSFPTTYSPLPEIHIPAHPAPPTSGRCIWIPHCLLFDFWTFFYFSFAETLRGKRTPIEITTHFSTPNSLLSLLAHRIQRTITFNFFYADILSLSASTGYIKFPFSIFKKLIIFL